MERIADPTRHHKVEDLPPISVAIGSLREKLGFTQRQLAVKLFVHQNSVSRYELGEIRPRPQVLFILRLLAVESGDSPLADAFGAAIRENGIRSLEENPGLPTDRIPPQGHELAISGSTVCSDKGTS
ncbi:MAG TPA: helix-turn-helix domain-containing protein [Bryobacteraceae bacterium]|jgi:transcriptional regulator with XRE-family HTH domain